MKHKFQFDKKTGTMMPIKESAQPTHDVTPPTEVRDTSHARASVAPQKDLSPSSIAVGCMRLKRTNEKTPVQLLDSKGNIESYLDSNDSDILMFRNVEDLDVCQITDERTGKALVCISGYALHFNFNMSELNSMQKVEQCLQGLTKLFRHKILSQMQNQED